MFNQWLQEMLQIESWFVFYVNNTCNSRLVWNLYLSFSGSKSSGFVLWRVLGLDEVTALVDVKSGEAEGYLCHQDRKPEAQTGSRTALAHLLYTCRWGSHSK